LKELQRYPTSLDPAHDILAQYLFHLRPDYYDHAAAFSEQSLSRQGKILHLYHYSVRSWAPGRSIIGSRLDCLNCLTTDLCADCHASWEESRGEMDFCRGHKLYEIPWPCWYQFKVGVVLEDGSTLPEIIDLLEEKFTAHLQIIEHQEIFAD
jgi:hypothetical protein